MIFIIILIVFLFLLFKYIRFKKSSIKIELDSVTFIEGSLGSGKTTILTYLALREFKKRSFLYHLFKILNFISFGLIKNKYKIPLIYSNYPIFINKKYGFSNVINIDVLNWDFRVEEDSIVVLDEVGYIFPNQKEKTDNAFTFGLTWLRHGCNALVLTASQSLSECNVSFRRKVNRCYHLHNCSKFFWFISSVEVVPVIISEDIKNVYSGNSENTLLQRFLFKFPKNNFNSRYARLLYTLNKDERIKLAYDFSLLLKKMNYKNGDKWRDFIYKF